MSWVALFVAIVFEVAGTTCLKLSDGLSRLLPAALMFPLYGISFAALAFALKQIPVSVGYAIWAGVGTALIAAIGIVAFKEGVSALKIASLVLVVMGVVGLNMSMDKH